MTPDTRQRPGGDPGVGQIAVAAVGTSDSTTDQPMMPAPPCVIACSNALCDVWHCTPALVTS